MSRNVLKGNEGLTVVLGLDHVMGYFIQVFDPTRADEDDEGLVANVDMGPFQPCETKEGPVMGTKGVLLELGERYISDEEPRKKTLLYLLALDMPL